MRIISGFLVLLFSLIIGVSANAQSSRISAPVGAQSSIRECYTGQGMKQPYTSCTEHVARVLSLGSTNYVDNPLRVGTDYPYGFNYSTKDKWTVCRETDGRSLIISGTYCKIVQGDNVNYWVTGLGSMSVRWETEYNAQTSPPLNTYFFIVYTSSLPTDSDWETNRARQNQICRNRGFGDMVGAIKKIRFDDAIELAYGKGPLMRTDPSIPDSATGRNERLIRRNQFHVLNCNADAYLARQQAIAKPF